MLSRFRLMTSGCTKAMSSAFTMMFSCLQMKFARSLGISLSRFHCSSSRESSSVCPMDGLALIHRLLSSMSSVASISAINANILSDTSGSRCPSSASVNWP